MHVTGHIRKCELDMTHSYVRHDSFISHEVTCEDYSGFRVRFVFQYGVATISRLLKIIGLFCIEPYKKDNILQKKPIIFRSLRFAATQW